MRRAAWAIVLVGCLDGGRPCLPGDAVRCNCADGRAGLATCSAGGYGACACGSAALDGGALDASLAPPPPPSTAEWQAVAGIQGSPEAVVFGAETTAPATVYVGTRERGMWRSLDGAATWTNTSMGITNPEVLAIAASPLNPSALFILGSRREAAYVFRTVDRAESWTPVDVGVPSGKVFDLFSFHAQPGLGPLAGGRDPSTGRAVVLFGQSGGTSWNVFSFGDVDGTVRAIAGSSADDVLLAADGAAGGVFRGKDRARDWVRSDDGIPREALAGVSALEIDPTSARTVLVGSRSASSQALFRSTDGGVVWSPSNAGLPAGAGVNAVRIRRTDPREVVCATTAGVYRSTDGGASWTSWALAMHDVRALAIDPLVPAGAPAIVLAVVAATLTEPSRLFRSPP